MPETLLPALFFQMLIVGYTPGPANLYALSASIRCSKRETFFVLLGLFTGFTIELFSLATLTHFIGKSMGDYVIYLKYAGCIYLTYLSYQLLKSSINLSGKSISSFSKAVMVQLTNAKIMLFELTVFSTYVLPYSQSITELYKVCLLIYFAGPLGNVTWVILGRFLKQLFEKHTKIIDSICAIMLFGCAIYVLFY